MHGPWEANLACLIRSSGRRAGGGTTATTSSSTGMHGLEGPARLPGPQADLPARPQGFKALKQTALKQTCKEPSNGRAGGQAGRRAGGQAGRRASSQEQFSGSFFCSLQAVSEQFLQPCSQSSGACSSGLPSLTRKKTKHKKTDKNLLKNC